MKNVIAVQDLQFGSTGKGQVAGSIAHVWGPDTVATAWGPNAGHTFRTAHFKMISTMLATSAICETVEQILIGPGSVINLEILAAEITASAKFLRGKHLMIHPQAMVVNESHREHEAKELLKIGSTMKGTGKALTDKVMRRAVTIKTNRSTVLDALGDAVVGADMSLSLSSRVYDRAVDISYKMIVEGAQGFSLGYHTDFYPHATSRDVSTAQLIADCRLPYPSKDTKFAIIGVCRSYPIRVANREQDGKYYTSGGHYDDQEEIQWEAIGRAPELTTVTKLPRRLFSFSYGQIAEACRIMQPHSVALTFCDYLLPPDDYFAPEEGDGPVIAMPLPVRERVDAIEQVTGRQVHLLSFGPTIEDMRELDEAGMMSPLSGSFLGAPHE